MSRVMIVGFGYVGAALAEILLDDERTVWGVSRSGRREPAGIEPITADILRDDLDTLLPEIDEVVYAVSAGAADENAYRQAYVHGLDRVLSVLEKRAHKPRRFVFVSSTGVYAQSGGEWVDEDSPTEPEHFSGKILLEGEARVRRSSLDNCCVRAGGIYGPGRTRFLSSVAAGRAFDREKPIYTNRIHRDDLAAIIDHLLSLPKVERLYNAVDSDPVPVHEVADWAREQLGLPLLESKAATASEMGRAQRSNKRCRNTRIKSSGFEFEFPSYRQGYKELLREIDAEGKR